MFYCRNSIKNTSYLNLSLFEKKKSLQTLKYEKRKQKKSPPFRPCLRQTSGNPLKETRNCSRYLFRWRYRSGFLVKFCCVQQVSVEGKLRSRGFCLLRLLRSFCVIIASRKYSLLLILSIRLMFPFKLTVYKETYLGFMACWFEYIWTEV